MLSDAEIREYAIQNERAFIARYEKELADGIDDPLHMQMTLTCYGHSRERLAELEAEAADELGLVKQLKEASNEPE